MIDRDQRERINIPEKLYCQNFPQIAGEKAAFVLSPLAGANRWVQVWPITRPHENRICCKSSPASEKTRLPFKSALTLDPEGASFSLTAIQSCALCGVLLTAQGRVNEVFAGPRCRVCCTRAARPNVSQSRRLAVLIEGGEACWTSFDQPTGPRNKIRKRSKDVKFPRFQPRSSSASAWSSRSTISNSKDVGRGVATS